MCRWALLAFPADFRARQGRALLQTLTADLRRRSVVASALRLFGNLLDTVRAGMAERLARRRHSIRPPASLNSVASGGSPQIGRWLVDTQHAWRSIRLRPGASAATTMVFALGIGLATAMFALADPYFLRPLPYERPQELAVIRLGSPGGRGGLPPGGRGAIPPPTPTLEAWRSRTDLFDGVAAYTGRAAIWVRSDAGLVSLTVTDVTENFFQVLGTRDPVPEASLAESSTASVPIVLASRGRQKITADLAAGTLVGENGVTFRVDGSLPERFLFPEPGQQNLEALSAFSTGPLRTITADGEGAYSSRRPLTVIARLKPGVDLALAANSLGAMMPSNARYAVQADWLSDVMTRRVRPLATGALTAGLLILLVCAGNVANLVAARGAWRAREFATREALGASRLDILRLRLLELGLMAVASAAGGLGIAWLALAASARVIPAEYVTLGAPAITGRVVTFSGLAALGVVVIVLIPLLMTVRPAAHRAPGRAVTWLRFGFTGVQSALSLVLAVGAAMLLQSYANLHAHDLGLDRTSLTVTVAPPHPGGRQGPGRVLDVQSDVDRLSRIPGVAAASARRGGMSGGSVLVNGVPTFAFIEDTAPGLFDAAGMTMRQGRALRPGDELWRAVVVNEAFAREHWPDRSPLGQVIVRDKRQAEVVGVVRDVFWFEFSFEPPAPKIYALVTGMPNTVEYVVRGAGDPTAYVEPIRRTLVAVHANDFIGEVETVGGRLADRVRDRTFATLVLTFYAVAAGAVTLAGLVGIVTFIVARRTREIAIRLAVGARPTHIRRLVVREVLAAAAAGAAVGLLVGRWLSTWLESFVFGIEAGNWPTALAAALGAVTIMILAALVPARRAVRLQPTVALRTE
jgi:predicted permease